MYISPSDLQRHSKLKKVICFNNLSYTDQLYYLKYYIVELGGISVEKNTQNYYDDIHLK